MTGIFSKLQNHLVNLKMSCFHLAVTQQTPKQVLFSEVTPTDVPATQLCLESKEFGLWLTIIMMHISPEINLDPQIFSSWFMYELS